MHILFSISKNRRRVELDLNSNNMYMDFKLSFFFFYDMKTDIVSCMFIIFETKNKK